MPQAHRNGDSRFCGASTIVTGQSTVFVNGILFAVQGDKDTHCYMGALSAVYGATNIFCEGKNAICAVGDTAADDLQGCNVFHPTGATDPKGHSPNVYMYGGGGGGGS